MTGCWEQGRSRGAAAWVHCRARMTAVQGAASGAAAAPAVAGRPQAPPVSSRAATPCAAAAHPDASAAGLRALGWRAPTRGTPPRRLQACTRPPPSNAPGARGTDSGGGCAARYQELQGARGDVTSASSRDGLAGWLARLWESAMLERWRVLAARALVRRCRPDAAAPRRRRRRAAAVPRSAPSSGLAAVPPASPPAAPNPCATYHLLWGGWGEARSAPSRPLPPPPAGQDTLAVALWRCRPLCTLCAPCGPEAPQRYSVRGLGECTEADGKRRVADTCRRS